MAYKDKDKQREASKEAMRRYRERQGITQQGITPASLVMPVITTIEDIKALTYAQAKAILDSWLNGHGTEYQYRLAKLGQAYAHRPAGGKKGWLGCARHRGKHA